MTRHLPYENISKISSYIIILNNCNFNLTPTGNNKTNFANNSYWFYFSFETQYSCTKKSLINKAVIEKQEVQGILLIQTRIPLSYKSFLFLGLLFRLKWASLQS